MAASKTTLVDDVYYRVEEVLLPVDADEEEIDLTMIDYVALSPEDSLTADVLQIWLAVTPGSSKVYKQWFNNVAENPFDSASGNPNAPNEVVGINLGGGFSSMKIIRAGSADGTAPKMLVSKVRKGR